MGNKFIYTNMGTNDILLNKKVHLDHHVELFCDNKKVDLP